MFSRLNEGVITTKAARNLRKSTPRGCRGSTTSADRHTGHRRASGPLPDVNLLANVWVDSSLYHVEWVVERLGTDALRQALL